nr:LysM domain-containing protein [uncultured Selenomonas sp.]DAW74197.1 MAG TPA: LysM [Caudoviricetes sp.]
MDAKKVITGCCIAGAAILLAGACNPWDDGGAVLVEETYVVRPGDTLWDIAETYCSKNTGTRRYILEYKEGIYENNPWLVDRKGLICPGDQLVLTYWVKEEDAGE